MTDKAKAAAILAKWNAGWRFAIDWPPGFRSKVGPVARVASVTENTGKGWRAISMKTHIVPFRDALKTGAELGRRA